MIVFEQEKAMNRGVVVTGGAHGTMTQSCHGSFVIIEENER